MRGAMAAPTDRKAWTLVVVAAGAVVIVAAIGLPFLNEHVEASGGEVLAQTSDSVTVRCLAPDVILALNGFEGTVTFTNCFPDAVVTGCDGPTEREGTSISCSVLDGTAELRLSAPDKTEFRFAVMGDSQGRNDILAEALDLAGDCEFAIHLGDMTTSGQSSEYDDFEATLRGYDIPIMTTPGNHDIKLGGALEYSSRFGPAAFSFEYSGTTFAFVDSSDQMIDGDEIEWLKKTFDGAERKVLATHVPSYDPFGDNHTLDADSCVRIQDFIVEERVDMALSGHIHAFHHMEEQGTDMVITGGAGGNLVDGVHHFIIVTVDESGFTYEKVDLESTIPQDPYVQVIGRDGSTVNLTYGELMLMDLEEAESSYENQYGNIGGQGTYRGVLVRDLLELVGGMEEDDTIRVTSTDSYSQEFGYLNAYTDAEWLALQGEMIVAVEFDGVLAPTWEDGPRIAMLPEDGLYSNSDCELTSYDGQGFWVYESAGARWVRNTLTITVVATP